MADEEANEDIKLGTAAAEEPATVGAPDANRYYYPPGKTEPELRPEFANAETEAAPEQTDETVAASGADDEESKPKRGKLPDDFPHVELLRAGGVSTYAQARNLKGDYGSVEGVAEQRGAEIDEALGE